MIFDIRELIELYRTWFRRYSNDERIVERLKTEVTFVVGAEPFGRLDQQVRGIVKSYATDLPKRVSELLKLFPPTSFDLPQLVLELYNQPEIFRRVLEQAWLLQCGAVEEEVRGDLKQNICVFNELRGLSELIMDYSNDVDFLLKFHELLDSSVATEETTRNFEFAWFRTTEGRELGLFSINLDEFAQEVRRKFNDRILKDDEDSNAKPANYFSIQRIKSFLPTLPDEKSRYIYLQKVRTALIYKDERIGIFTESGDKEFNISEDTLAFLERELATHEKILTITGAVSGQQKRTQMASTSTTGSEFSLRCKVLTLLYLMFQNFEVPDRVQPESVVKLIKIFTGADSSDIRKLVRSPTATKPSKQSKRLLSKDLELVAKELAKVGIQIDVTPEIEFSFEELDAEN